jgi:thiol-disulfide isomerase/thioredoxin/outer membrane lipoprotein-sorting protein
MCFYLLGVPIWLSVQVSAPIVLTGTWLNQNREAGSVTQVVVRQEQNRTLVHAWGACQPVDCDWGEVEAESWNGILTPIWKHGFATNRMQLVPQPDGRLLVVTKSEFHDQSGRTDPGAAEFFQREDLRTADAEDLAAKAVLRRVAETYLKLADARLEMTRTVDRTTSKSSARTVMNAVLLVAQPHKYRFEATGGSEPLILIADGRTLWRVYPRENEYTRVPQGDLPYFLSPLAEYALLDRSRGSARVTGHESIFGASCSVVRIEREHKVVQTLWIDDSTYLIRKETREEPPEGSPDGSTSYNRESLWTTLTIGGPVNPALLTYNPNGTQAKERTQLQRQAPVSMRERPAPDFVLRDLDSREVRLSELRGKVVLLDFWATWCGPCRAAFPMIELLHRSFKEKGLVVYGIDDEPPQIAREFLKKYGYLAPSLVDANRDAATKYNVGGIPTTVLIDREGRVAFYEVGPSYEQLRDALRSAGIW